MTRHISLVARTGAILAIVGCSAAPDSGNEQDPGTDFESVSGSCSLKVVDNSYDGPNSFGTVTLKNLGSRKETGFTVSFDAPAGHCTDDLPLPPGGKLST